MPPRSSRDLVQVALLGEAVDAGPFLVLVADEELRYLAVNATACEVLGYAREELLALRASDVGTARGSAERFARLLADGAASGTATLRRKDASTFRCRYWAQRVRVASLEVYVGFFTRPPA